MKTEIMLKRIRFCAVILLVLFHLIGTESLAGDTASEFQSVDFNQIPEVLTMISNQVHSNYNRIKTWQGELDVTINDIYEGVSAERIFNTHTDGSGEIPGAVKRHTESRIQFAIDIEKDFLYAYNYRENPSQYADLESGRDLGSKSVRHFTRSVITPEYYFHCSPATMRDGVFMSRKAVKEVCQRRSDCPTCEGPPIFDPRAVYDIQRPIWETFPGTIQFINKHGKLEFDGGEIKVEEREDDEIRLYRIQKCGYMSSEQEKRVPENYMIYTRIFSSAKGFNMIFEQISFGDGSMLLKNTWDYELIDGVYLPKKTTEQVFRRDTGKLSSKIISTYKNIRVNQPIPEETFSYKNLGLKNGDKFIDKIEGKEYTYQDEQLIQVKKESK